MTTDLLGETTLEGLSVELERGCNWCGHLTLTIVGPGVAPHAAALACTRCGRTGGWLSKEQASFVRCVISKFGCPSGPIKVCHPSGASRATLDEQNNAR